MDNFLGKSKLNFWTKNEDFEQCENSMIFFFKSNQVIKSEARFARGENSIRKASFSFRLGVPRVLVRPMIYEFLGQKMVKTCM